MKENPIFSKKFQGVVGIYKFNEHHIESDPKPVERIFKIIDKVGDDYVILVTKEEGRLVNIIRIIHYIALDNCKVIEDGN